MSRVLAALLARLSAKGQVVVQRGGGVGRVSADTDALARRLLEQLLAPSLGTSDSKSCGAVRSAVGFVDARGGGAGKGGGEGLVRGLDTASTAALMQLQVYVVYMHTAYQYTDMLVACARVQGTDMLDAYCVPVY